MWSIDQFLSRQFCRSFPHSLSYIMTLLNSAKKSSFIIVYIPCDDSHDLEEWELPLPASIDDQIGCLTSRLRRHFSAQSGAHSSDEQKAVFRDQLLKQLPAGATVTEDMMAMMLQMDSLVDSVALSVQRQTSISVNLYVDDQGTSKGLGVNTRATVVTHLCGKQVQVRGDAFIARVFDNDNDFERLDFRLEELHLDAGKTSSKSSMKWIHSNSNSNAITTCARTECTSEGTLRCSGCKQVSYCSKGCQKSSWRMHKSTCIGVSKTKLTTR